MKTLYIQWNHSPVVGVVLAPQAVAQGATSITDNGVHRTVRRWAHMVEALQTLGLFESYDPLMGVKPKLSAGVTATGPDGVSSETKALMAWAKKAAPSLAVGASHTEGSASLQNAGAVVMPTGIPSVPEITYEGFKTEQRHSAHAFDALHRMVVAAVKLCIDTWGWSATGLVVQFHHGKRAMGLAFAPGKGVRRISLARELLAKYDMDSISRTTLHELAHHAREELFPRNRTRYSDAHDAKFCEILSKVDPTVAPTDRRACTFFTDDIDVQVVAQVAEKSGIVYSAGAGVMRLGHGPDRNLRWRWDATGTSKWRSTWQKLNGKELSAFLRQFPAAERPAFPVEYEATGSAFIVQLMSEDETRTGIQAAMKATSYGSITVRSTAGAFIPKLAALFHDPKPIMEAMTA